MNIEIVEDCPKCKKTMSSYYSSKSMDGKAIVIYFECKDCDSEYRHSYNVILDKSEELKIY